MVRKRVVAAVAALTAVTVGLGACSKNDSGGGNDAKPVVIWVDSDGCVTASQYCSVFLTTVLKNDAKAVQTAVENASAGVYPTKDTVGDLKNGGTGLSSFHDFDGKVDSSLTSELNSVKSDIISGKITITSKSQPSGSDTLTPSSSGTANANYSACMVTDTGGIDDKSFNAASWEGMQAAQKAGRGKVQYVQSKSESDYAPNIAALISKGCKLVIGVGGLMSDAINNAAKSHPSLHFAIVDGAGNGSNVQGLQINTAQSGFLAGYLAAGYSKSGKVATYGGLKIAPVTVYMDGFWEGVQYYNKQKGKKVQVLGWNETSQSGTFAGDFANPNKGQTLTKNFLNQGADVIFPVAGGTGLGSASVVSSTK